MFPELPVGGEEGDWLERDAEPDEAEQVHVLRDAVRRREAVAHVWQRHGQRVEAERRRRRLRDVQLLE